MASIPRLADRVHVQRQPVLADGEFEWGYGLVTDSHPEGLPCSAVVAALVAQLDGETTVGQAIAALGRGAEPAAAAQLARVAVQAMELLYVDGTVGHLGNG